VFALLDDRLTKRAAGLYGGRPLAAVALQVRQLRRRLRAFAAWQVGQVAQGWRIAESEWGPEGGQVPFVVDKLSFGVRGRIDRVDVNTDGKRWRVLDYKTGENANTPRSVHGPRRGGGWKDLQLPLYALLVESLAEDLSDKGYDSEPGLGYVLLPRDVEKTGASMADWNPDERAEALECARDVVRGVRRGEFAAPGTARTNDPILAALAGQGLLSADDGEPGDEDA